MTRRNRHFLILLPMMALGACAGGPGASEEGAAPRGAVSPAGRAAQVLAIYDVADLVDPPGDADRVAEVAMEIRALVTFLLGDADPEAWIGARGSAVVVLGVPEIHLRVRRHLDERRRDAAARSI